MIWFSPTQKVTVWRVEDKGKYSNVQFSSSRKEQGEGGAWLNSSWSFVRFVKDAHTKASNLQPKDRIILTKAGMTLEPYEKDGEKQYPKTPAMVVFDFEMVDGTKKSEPAQEDNFDSDSIPF